MLSSKAKSMSGGSGTSSSVDGLSLWLSQTLQWFSRRPLLALLVFLVMLLVGSVLLPLLILSYFSASFLPAQGGTTDQLFALTSSRGGQTAFREHLQEALGIEQNQLSPQLQQLAQHGAEYARSKQTTTQTVTPAAASNESPGALPATPVVPAKVDHTQVTRQAAVVAAFKHAYTAYESKCMGQDEFHPLSKTCSNWIGSGLTIIDALPTMMLMGAPMEAEVARAREWVRTSMSFNKMNSQISFFETTIRVLGGLISAYDLSNGAEEGKIYLTRATELGEKLLGAFSTPSGLPRSQVNLATGASGDYSWTGGASLLAEIGTCQMEFAALSQRTGNPKYAAAAQKPIDVLDNLHVEDGLYPIYISAQTGQLMNSKISLGAMGDSFYEYLLKMWLLTGRTNAQAQRMYRASMKGVLSKLLQTTSDADGSFSFLADLHGGGRLERKMDHLVCFVPGMLALGVEEGIVQGDEAAQHMKAAKDIMRTCFESYNRQSSQIGPEVMTFTPGLGIGEASYKLRPEMVESLYVMWRVTGEEQYREWGWQTFQAIERHCRVDGGGYAALVDMRHPSNREDKMESFFLAETLKYFYLLFSDEEAMPLTGNKKPGEYFVFNTECHPIRSWQESAK